MPPIIPLITKPQGIANIETPSSAIIIFTSIDLKVAIVLIITSLLTPSVKEKYDIKQ
jgi:hypothetical protein